MRRAILKFKWRIGAVLTLSCAFAACTSGPSDGSRVVAEKPAPGGLGDFTLLDHKGEIHSLYREADAKAIVIIGQGNSCPIVQKYAQTIRELQAEFGPRGVAIFLINANPQDERQSIAKEAEEYGYNVPILEDPSQIVTKELGITRTSEAVVIDPRGWTVRFRGAIDDRLGYGIDKQEPKRRFLADALKDILAGREVQGKPEPAKGCLFSFHPHKNLYYAKDIAPILRKKCANCHSTQAKYPPFFDSYESLKGWSSMIRETLFTDRMPPAGYDPQSSRKFKLEPMLLPLEKSRLVSWIDAGMPRGQGADPLTQGPVLAKQPPLPPKLWEVGMDKPQAIGPKGTMEYLYFQIGGPAPHDMWVTATRTTSSNPRQLHHSALMITSKPLSFFEEAANLHREETPKFGETAGEPI